MEERLQKLMSQAGIASRREAEEMILKGRVTVNGQRAQLGDKANPSVDDVRVDGSRLRIEEDRVYIAINKPMGIVTAVESQSQEKRRTVRELVPVPGHLYPVGRLDADSEGLVLLTNDGDLAQKLTHPRYQHPKVYEVGVQGSIPDDALDIWRRGIVLDDGPTKPAEVKVLTRDKDMTWLRITMSEGRKRQIRRIAATLGYPVRRLIRTELDILLLGSLKVGGWRYLTPVEINALQKSAASEPHRGKRERLPATPEKRPGKAAPRVARSAPRSRSAPAKGAGPRRSSRTTRTGRAPGANTHSRASGQTRTPRSGNEKRHSNSR